jgi:hypothetical protein
MQTLATVVVACLALVAVSVAVAAPWKLVYSKSATSGFTATVTFDKKVGPSNGLELKIVATLPTDVFGYVDCVSKDKLSFSNKGFSYRTKSGTHVLPSVKGYGCDVAVTAEQHDIGNGTVKASLYRR